MRGKTMNCLAGLMLMASALAIISGCATRQTPQAKAQTGSNEFRILTWARPPAGLLMIPAVPDGADQ